MIRFLLAALLALSTSNAYAQAGCPAGVTVACFATLDDGPVAPGAPAGKSLLTGGIYNATLPTLTNGQQAAVQLDSSGRLIGSVTATPQDGLPSTGTATAVGVVTWTPQVGASTAYIDTIGYSSLSVILIQSTGSTVNFEVSNDAANWVAVQMSLAVGGVSSNWGGATSGSLFFTSNTARYFRVRLNSYTSGTTSVQASLRASPAQTNTPSVTINGQPLTVIPNGQNSTLTVAQTVTASSAYAAGNAVGGLITLTSINRAAGLSVLVQSVLVTSKSLQTVPLDLIFFNASPTGSTCSDKTAVSIATGDATKIVGVAHVTDWTAGGIASVGQMQQAPIGITPTGTAAYACLVSRGTPTWTSTSDVSVVVSSIMN